MQRWYQQKFHKNVIINNTAVNVPTKQYKYRAESMKDQFIFIVTLETSKNGNFLSKTFRTRSHHADRGHNVSTKLLKLIVNSRHFYNEYLCESNSRYD